MEYKSELVFIQADSKEEAEAIAKANLDNGTIQLRDYTALEISASPAANQEASPFDHDYKMPEDIDATDNEEEEALNSNVADALSDLSGW